MKKLNVSFDKVTDTTGYLFSLAKSLSAAMYSAGYGDIADDAVAASGFAFRMWVDGEQLCPSAMSVWDFTSQKEWVENAGIVCGYVERLWGEDDVEEARRSEAIEMIKRSIDADFAPVAWDVGGCEWGLVIGYDDESERLFTLKPDGAESSIFYGELGRLEVPILSVMTVNGRAEKSPEQLVADTKRLAAFHLRGEEWCENSQGLAAYDALIGFIESKLTPDTEWNLEYYLGTYAALKWYACRFFEKYGETELSELYSTVHNSWQAAFEMKSQHETTDCECKNRIIDLLKTAKQAEENAVALMS